MLEGIEKGSAEELAGRRKEGKRKDGKGELRT